MEAKEELYQELLNKGQQLLAVTPEGPDSNTEQDLANLRDKWESVRGKTAERKVRAKRGRWRFCGPRPRREPGRDTAHAHFEPRLCTCKPLIPKC